MTLPILNKAMWVCFDEAGNIMWSTMDWTKEDSEARAAGRLHICKMVAMDIEVIE